MVYEPVYKKPGDLIRSEDWNRVQDELVGLRSYIESMTRSITLASLPSAVGTAYGLTGNQDPEFNYNTEVLGLITKQYFVGKKETGDICRFGINDYMDVLSYWSGAADGEKEAMTVTFEYVDGTSFTSDSLFINEWSSLRPRSPKNPYIEFLQSPNQRLWYRYALINPNPEKEIRYVVFRDVNPESAIRVANVIHYTTRVRPLTANKK